jgi:hypothetical protein
VTRMTRGCPARWGAEDVERERYWRKSSAAHR